MKKFIVLFIAILLCYSIALVGCDKSDGYGNSDGWTTTIEPTCTKSGIKVYTYENDPESEKIEIIPALGHDWGDWELLTSEPTQAASPDKRHNCKRCGKTETFVKSVLVDIAPLTPVSSSKINISDYDRTYEFVKQVSDGWICSGSINIGGKHFGLIAKYSADGDRLWEDYFGGTSNYGDFFTTVEELPNNEGYLVRAHCYSVDGDIALFKWAPHSNYFCLIKYSNEGKVEWLMDANNLSQLSIDEQGFVAVYGHKTTLDNSIPYNRLKILKFDFDGNIIMANDLTDDLVYDENQVTGYYTMNMLLPEIIQTPQGYILFGEINAFFAGWGGTTNIISNIQVFVDNDFHLVTQEESEIRSIDKHILLDDGFVMFGKNDISRWHFIAKFDYQMNKLWQFDWQLEYEKEKQASSDVFEIYLNCMDMTIIDSKLYIVGFTGVRDNYPRLLIFGLAGELLYNSGKLPAKEESSNYYNIYPYKDGYLVRAFYHNYNGNGYYEWEYFEIDFNTNEA